MREVKPLVAPCQEFGPKTNEHDIHGYHTYWQNVDGSDYFFAVPTEEKVQENVEALSEHAGIPFAFRKTKLKSMDMSFYSQNITKEMMTIQDYVSRFGEYVHSGFSLYIWSHYCGSGKTMLSSAIGNEILAHGYSVKFSTTEAMFSAIQETYNGKAEHSEKYVTDSYKDCDLLILDDFGSEKISEWVDSKLFEIINARIEHKRATVYTSNIEPIKLMYNRRIIDRVKSNCEEIHWPEEGVRRSIGYIQRKERNASQPQNATS